MFSGNFGVSWNIVARGVHPPSSDEYTGNDFVWLVIITNTGYTTCSCIVCPLH